MRGGREGSAAPAACRRRRARTHLVDVGPAVAGEPRRERGFACAASVRREREGEGGSPAQYTRRALIFAPPPASLFCTRNPRVASAGPPLRAAQLTGAGQADEHDERLPALVHFLSLRGGAASSSPVAAWCPARQKAGFTHPAVRPSSSNCCTATSSLLSACARRGPDAQVVQDPRTAAVAGWRRLGAPRGRAEKERPRSPSHRGRRAPKQRA